MPIRPDRQHLYPADWATRIVPMIRERSGNCCEACGVRNHQLVARNTNGHQWAYINYGTMQPQGPCYDAVTGHETTGDVQAITWRKPVKIVLTVGHINHDETDNRAENLAHWCQLHHNRHDAEHRAATRKARTAT